MKRLGLLLLFTANCCLAQKAVRPKLPSRPIVIHGTVPPLHLSQEGKTTYLTSNDSKPLHVPLSLAWSLNDSGLAPYGGTRLGGVPDHYIVFTDKFLSNPGDPMAQCGPVFAPGQDTGGKEEFLHIVSLSGTPHETFAVKIYSCLESGDDVENAHWDQKASTLQAHIPGHATMTFHVSPEGELTPPPPKPVYSK